MGLNKDKLLDFLIRGDYRYSEVGNRRTGYSTWCILKALTEVDNHDRIVIVSENQNMSKYLFKMAEDITKNTGIPIEFNRSKMLMNVPVFKGHKRESIVYFKAQFEMTSSNYYYSNPDVFRIYDREC